MERMWRKVNQGLTLRSSKATSVLQSTDTASSAGFGDPQNVVAVSGRIGNSLLPPGGNASGTIQHANTASSERRRRRRRRSRPRRDGSGAGGDHSKKTNNSQVVASSVGDASLRQRAVAKLKMFNFHLNWDLHMNQCKPCGPRSSGNILTRRLCRNRRRDDNELYRSNSFKFERFERKDGNEMCIDTLQKQISVCDDYSLPIDFVKKRPSSFDPSLAERIPDNWTSPSPLSEHVSFLEPAVVATASVKIVEGYSDPKDSKKYRSLREKKPRPHAKPQKDHPVSSDSSAPKSTDDEQECCTKVPELNSPDSISEDLVRPLQSQKSPKRSTIGPDTSKRNPSPYYYSDLFKSKDANKNPGDPTLALVASFAKDLPLKYKKSSSLDVPSLEREVSKPKRYSVTEEGVRIIRCDSPSTSTSDDSDCTECQKRREWHANALAIVRESCHIVVPDPSMPPHRLLGPAVCACAAPNLGDDIDELFRPRSIFYVHQPGAHECSDCTLGSDKSSNNVQLHDDDMSSGGRTRQLYETAFDCKIARSDDDLDEVDRMTNHSVLLHLNNTNCSSIKASPAGSGLSKEGRDKSKLKIKLDQKRAKSPKTTTTNATKYVSDGGSASTLSHDLENIHINNTNVDNINSNTKTTSSSQLPVRGYTPSPPSTAPLPVKFPGKHERFYMNSIKSAPNLPSSNPAAQHPRLKDLRLPSQALRAHDAAVGSSDGSIVESSYDSPRNIQRPRSIALESARVMDLKGHHGSGRHHHKHQKGRNFSSTESMATSSSGGSMESLRSSTSEGNRSTSSSESRHSTSLSSHSSDSGPKIHFPLRAPVLIHSKLHILSPISDKSSQEPASETSEFNNRNNNSQKVSPEDLITNHPEEQTDTTKVKRRIPQNKALLHLTGGDEIQGSDSGISLHSRDGSRSAFQSFGLTKLNLTMDKVDNSTSQVLPPELNDLPFDMPKLRRRKILQQDACTSGSVTSVDIGDLPFDMPKLRRRLRVNPSQADSVIPQTSTESSGISQASSSHSVREDKPILGTGMFRQNLTLNLNEPKATKRFSGSLDFRERSRALNLNFGGAQQSAVDLIDAAVPLERQGWYHGAITRIEAENTLRPLSEGSFLVRNCESTRQDFSLSLKSAKGFMHMRIQRNSETAQFILGQFSRPFDSIPEMIRHFCLNRLPVRGAEHMVLLDPVIAQLL